MLIHYTKYHPYFIIFIIRKKSFFALQSITRQKWKVIVKIIVEDEFEYDLELEKKASVKIEKHESSLVDDFLNDVNQSEDNKGIFK